jgi:uncharacterized protein (TIGR03437 family)
MERSRKILIAKCATVLAVMPVVVIAFPDGAPAKHTGAPGEQTCAECHSGTAVNSASGNARVTYSGGTNYVPGERGKFTVTITDTGGGRSAFGFQAVAKLTSNAQAGAWVAGQGLKIVCEDDRNLPCRDTAPVQYVTHSQPRANGTFEFEWTPPASASGNITVYVAGNAANGNGQNTGDRIYTSSITLMPAAAPQPNRPTISSGGVADAFNFQEGVAENSWVALFGTNLSTETRDWNGTPELGQQRLPTTLGGVSVTIDGKPAPIYAITPTQVNVLTPVGVGAGNVQVVLKNAAGETTATARSIALLPGLYAPFAESGRLFVTAVENSTGAILGKRGVDPRATRAFRPGDVVQFYANGLGQTNPPVGDNQFISSARPLVNTPAIRINDVPVEILGSALVGSGLFQVNGRIPDVPNGDHPIVIEIGGARSASNVSISIQR